MVISEFTRPVTRLVQHRLLLSVSTLALLATIGCGTPGTDSGDSAQPDRNAEQATANRLRSRDADRDGYLRAPWGSDCNDTRTLGKSAAA